MRLQYTLSLTVLLPVLIQTDASTPSCMDMFKKAAHDYPSVSPNIYMQAKRNRNSSSVPSDYYTGCEDPTILLQFFILSDNYDPDDCDATPGRKWIKSFKQATNATYYNIGKTILQLSSADLTISALDRLKDAPSHTLYLDRWFPPETNRWVTQEEQEMTERRLPVEDVRPIPTAESYFRLGIKQFVDANGLDTDPRFNTKVIKVGIISDRINPATLQGLRNLGLTNKVNFVNQAANDACSGDEGSAMLTIVATNCPTCEIFFGSVGCSSTAEFVAVIDAMGTAGVDIVADDVQPGDQNNFQEDVLARAVDRLARKGVMYFAAAGNAQNKKEGNAQTAYRGVITSVSTDIPGIGNRNVVRFSDGNPFLTITRGIDNRNRPLIINWAQPNANGAATLQVRYQAVLVNTANDDIIAVGIDNTQVPLIQLLYPPINAGDTFRLYLLENGTPRWGTVQAADRQLYIGQFRAKAALTPSTTGATFGHPAALLGFGTATADVTQAPPAANSLTSLFETGTKVTKYSSDGGLLICFADDGTLFAGGCKARNQPSVTGGDTTRNVVIGFNPRFSGTSAAAPAMAALAARLKQFHGDRLTADVFRQALAKPGATIDIEDTGFDVTSGFGIPIATSMSTAIKEIIPSTCKPVITGRDHLCVFRASMKSPKRICFNVKDIVRSASDNCPDFTTSIKCHGGEHTLVKVHERMLHDKQRLPLCSNNGDRVCVSLVGDSHKRKKPRTQSITATVKDSSGSTASVNVPVKVYGKMHDPPANCLAV